MTAPCPHPEKRRYATREAAERRGNRAELRIDKLLYPYQCICGWWHLTKNSKSTVPTWATARPEDVARLTALPAAEFEVLVSDDIKTRLPVADRVALRHPDNLTRWRWALKALRADITRQLAARARDASPLGAEWRTRTQHYRDTLTIRIAECQTLRAQAAHQRAAA
jgi:hypothetical protein